MVDILTQYIFYCSYKAHFSHDKFNSLSWQEFHQERTRLREDGTVKFSSIFYEAFIKGVAAM